MLASPSSLFASLIKAALGLNCALNAILNITDFLHSVSLESFFSFPDLLFYPVVSLSLCSFYPLSLVVAAGRPAKLLPVCILGL